MGVKQYLIHVVMDKIKCDNTHKTFRMMAGASDNHNDKKKLPSAVITVSLAANFEFVDV